MFNEPVVPTQVLRQFEATHCYTRLSTKLMEHAIFLIQLQNLQFCTQVALASRECVQLPVILLDKQSTSLASFPVQPTLVREMGPLPGPNAAPDCAVASASR